MKQIYILFLVITSICIAQTPSNYYDSANGLSGYALKTQLKNITSAGHTARGYDQLYDGAGITGSQGYIDTHSDVMTASGNQYENDGTVLDMYSENPTGVDPYNFTHNVNNGGNQSAEGDCYNREHLVPQSTFNSQFPMQSDIHHVIPTDCRVNNFRSNLPFGEVATANFTSLNGSQRGSSAIVGYSGTMFEPIDEFKGDIARALLYFATRYEDNLSGYTSFDMFDGSTNQAFPNWAVIMLLDWHNNVDPVDQGNANPFVDHPEYANLIWNPTNDTEDPTAPTNLMTSNPSPSTIDLSWTASTDNIGVVSYDVYVDAVNMFNTTMTSFTVTGLNPETNYCFTVIAKDAAGNQSALSNQACETTTAGSTGGTAELFFSEYVEGGGNNKALEIANFTGAPVSLSTYTLKLASNSNMFGTTYTFPNIMLADNDVFVVANSGLLAACQAQQDDVNNNITGFNGNDAIGLFKNNVLIDILGTEASGTTFGANVTLIRNPDILFPSTTYNATEWTTEAQDDCTNLGIHNQNTLSTGETELFNVSIFPNPLKDKTLYVNTDSEIIINVYDILGKKVLKVYKDATSNSINLSSLKQGVYFLKIQSDSRTITKKLIKQ